MADLPLIILLAVSGCIALFAFVKAIGAHNRLERHHPGFCDAMRRKANRRR